MRSSLDLALHITRYIPLDSSSAPARRYHHRPGARFPQLVDNRQRIWPPADFAILALLYRWPILSPFIPSRPSPAATACHRKPLQVTQKEEGVRSVRTLIADINTASSAYRRMLGPPSLFPVLSLKCRGLWKSTHTDIVKIIHDL